MDVFSLAKQSKKTQGVGLDPQCYCPLTTCRPTLELRAGGYKGGDPRGWLLHWGGKTGIHRRAMRMFSEVWFTL